MRRVLLSSKWWALHVTVVAVVLVFLRLGEWQWHRAHAASGTLQNFGYAFEWPVFALFVVFFWVKTIREEVRPKRNGDVVDDAPDAAGPEMPRKRKAVVPPPPEEEDAELAAYNAHLARLNARHQRQAG